MFVSIGGPVGNPMIVGINFVDLGNITTAQRWNLTDLTLDNTWRELDTTTLVPKGAKCIVCRCYLYTLTPAGQIEFRTKGNTNSINRSTVVVSVGMTEAVADIIIIPDAAGIIEYKGSAITWNVITITPRAYFR